MMNETAWLGRTRLLVGDNGLEKLMNAHVLIVGLGGVGSYAAEYIARAGIGKITICDGDVVDPTNRNRQLQALATTHGASKAGWMQERIKAINPEVELNVVEQFLKVQPVKDLLLGNKFDYVIDAIDSITPKLTLISTCYAHNIPLISSMGAGGKMDPTQIRIDDISKTYNCKLAQYVRKRLKRHKIYKGVKTVFSAELAPLGSLMLTDGANFKKSAYGTISYMPAAFGGTCASVVIRDLVGYKERKS
jgi:tRNA threonylcarbamoyladenosine dehydratase